MTLSTMKVYHYTTLDGWEKMNEGDSDYSFWNPATNGYTDGRLVRGLWPNRRLITQGIESALTPPESTRPHIFAMLSSNPELWLRNEAFPGIFDYLIRGIISHSKYPCDERKLVLLEVNLLHSDKPFVVDYAHVVREGRIFDKTKNHKHIAEGYKKYWDSKISLQQYSGRYDLPEVVFEGPIPLERLNKLWERESESFRVQGELNIEELTK